MVLTSTSSELIEDEISQYYYTVLNAKEFTHNAKLFERIEHSGILKGLKYKQTNATI